MGSRAKTIRCWESNDSRDIRLDYYLRLGFHVSIWDNDDESAANDRGAACYGLCVFEMMVGKWGAVVIDGGLVISLVGVWLSWTSLPIETMGNMAEDGLLPKAWGKLNKKWGTNLCYRIDDVMYRMSFYFHYYSLTVLITLLTHLVQQLFSSRGFS